MENTDWISFFLECIENENAKEWNQYKRKNRKEQFDLSKYDLKQKKLEQFDLKNMNFSEADLSESEFKLCAFDKSNLEKINGFGVKFINCSFVSSKLKDSVFSMAVFLESDFRYTDFTNAKIHQVDFENCKSDYANFILASFNNTSLMNSRFAYADLRGCEILACELNGAYFEATVVDGSTVIWDCYYDEKTDFTGVGLSNARIEPALLSSFQCNIRRIWWTQWYAHNYACQLNEQSNKAALYFSKLRCKMKYIFYSIIHFIVRGFWWITDYGSSTTRLLVVFALTTLFYALLYVNFPWLTNDIVLNQEGFSVLGFSRALYFAVIVMTSVGFGDVAASHQSTIGHLVIILQSLSGYILLGAFLVRIGILFQGEFPVDKQRLKNSGKK